MRRLMLAVVAAAAVACSAEAASGKIIKTLPHLLDAKGRHTVYPGLFERDAYQAELKKAPEKCSGIRFDVQWKAREPGGKLRLKVELRGAKTPPRQFETFEKIVSEPAFKSKWSALTILGDDYQRIGSVISWRVSLWDGDELLSEEKSFLWQ